ncbi:integrin alpha-M [Austrofundulus limnaeus]|uniref:Integrin alpha-M n=1 Tax=Austrofundulus limnaeus TaxID=52670 RepID=A0A2I4BNN7_AUSLI|nr:PREDICTED: integrin alpha-M-like [Austrofundulus limnaeus]
MDWIIFVTFFWSVFKAALCFNIDPVAWKSLSNSAAGFGYQVVQRKADLLISAPLEPYAKDRKGKIFRCTTETCTDLTLPEQNAAVNMSLGLAMTADPITEYTLACGPTIPKDCKSITMYNGLCIEIDKNNKFGKSYSSSTEECQTQADIAILLDGSGSVKPNEFQNMRTFVKNLIGAFQGKDTRFAIIQFSSRIVIHYKFNTFSTTGWKFDINNIYQLGGGTMTAAAIKIVVNDVFSQNAGSRSNAKKILLVITDGESHDGNNLPEVIQSANDKNIVRFSIGVGNAFKKDKARRELELIASEPSKDFVFQVQNFEALEKIQNNLQEKIFSIEGSQSSGESLKLEMSQEGFRAAYTTEGIQMAIVGANQWRGGYKKYLVSEARNTGSFEPTSIEPDSYVGYSMAVAQTTLTNTLTVVGAPRYKHRGAVITVFQERPRQQIDPFQQQTGGYFGAEVCAMDVNSDSFTDLILISAPMYKDQDREGRVYVCTLARLNVECNFDSPSQLTVLRGDPSNKGRFGSSLAVLPDLNADTLNDLAVGAPLENNNQGSIYIFHGETGGRIKPTYSQRIAASEVKSGLKFFGLSISQWSYDQSGDTLPELAVGSKGAVVLLRSRPVVMVDTTVSFNPKEIPTLNVDCAKPLKGTATICFTMRRLSGRDSVQAKINYTLTLDATRETPNNRAYISKDTRDKTGSVAVVLNVTECNNVKFFIKSCPEDALNPLQNELSFTFDGSPSNTSLRPSLSQEAQTTTRHRIGFEISCGADMVCTDNLKVDFNFTRSSEVKVGIDELLDVTVSVENRGENSYNSHVILTYPVGLSYRKFTSLRGRIECNSLDSEDGVMRGKTDCTVDQPIFKTNSMAVFIVSYGFNPSRKLERRIFVTANATSGNQQHAPSSKLYKKEEIGVKYSILITMESSLSYNNFTFGKSNLQKPFQQIIKVTNNIRALNFTVVIRVPVKLGDKDIWVDTNSFQIADCQRGNDEKPAGTNFIAKIKENKSIDCSVAWCRVFRCSRFMERLEQKTYKISANLSSAWIEQIGLPSAKFILTSTASLEYDRNQYIYFSTTSNNVPPVRLIEAEIEVFPEPDFTKEIVGGSLGGLAFLGLLTAGLYKAGFFKSKYNEMVNESAEGEAGPQEAQDAAPTEG